MNFNNFVCQNLFKKYKIDIYDCNDPYLLLLVQYYYEYTQENKNSKYKCYKCGGRGHLAVHCDDKCPYCLLNHKNKPCIKDLITVTQNVLDIKNKYNKKLLDYRRKKTFKTNPQSVLEILEEMIKEEAYINRKYEEKINKDNEIYEKNNRSKKYSTINDLIFQDVMKYEYNNMIREVGKYAKYACEKAKQQIAKEYKAIEEKNSMEIKKMIEQKRKIIEYRKKDMMLAKNPIEKEGQYRMMKLQLNRINAQDKRVIKELQKVEKIGPQKLGKVSKGKGALVTIDKNGMVELINELAAKKRDIIRYTQKIKQYKEDLRDNSLELFDTQQRDFKDLESKKKYIQKCISMYQNLKEKCDKEIKMVDFKINNYTALREKELQELDKQEESDKCILF